MTERARAITLVVIAAMNRTRMMTDTVAPFRLHVTPSRMPHPTATLPREAAGGALAQHCAS